MPQSFFQIGVHLVFSTKNRLRYLNSDVIDATHAYLATVLRDKGCGQVVAGGTDDHVHIFCTLPKDEKPIQLVQIVKQESSKRIKATYRGFNEFSWQRGYGIFSVSPQYFDDVIDYVDGQSRHHESMSFQEEYRMFLRKYNIEYDEAYVWD